MMMPFCMQGDFHDLMQYDASSPNEISQKGLMKPGAMNTLAEDAWDLAL